MAESCYKGYPQQSQNLARYAEETEEKNGIQGSKQQKNREQLDRLLYA